MNTVRFRFRTGGDDLRGDSLLEALFVFADGTTLRATLHAAGTSGWDNDALTRHDVNVSGKPPITHIALLFNQGGGGINGDNWNMQDISVFADGNEESAPLFERTGGRDDSSCTHRFKGHFETPHDSPEYDMNLNAFSAEQELRARVL
jgi:hypothetical protein